MCKKCLLTMRRLGVVLALSSVSVPLLHADEPDSRSGRRNVLFIAIDDLKPLAGCYGVPWIESPNIDDLASRGTLFAACYCQVPLCAPTRTSVLSGLRPDSTGVYFNPFRVRNILRVHLPEVVTLPQHFKNCGYVTCGMGKVFDGRTVDEGDDAISWSERYVRQFEVAPEGFGTRGYQNPKTQERLARTLKESGTLGMGPPFEAWTGPDNMYLDGAMAITAAKKIAELARQKRPFFLAVGFHKPHLPFIAPKKYWDLYDQSTFKLATNQRFPDGSPPIAAVIPNSGELREYAGVPKSGPIPAQLQRDLIHAYAACVSFIDAQVGLLMQAVKENGIEQETVICVWGDHGFHLGEHGHWGKSTTYEDATRAPLIIRAPGLGEGVQTKSLVELLDVYPTLCELAGVSKPAHLQGTSLVPLMHDPQAQVHVAAISQSSTVDSQMSPQLVSGALREDSRIQSFMGWTLRTDRYRYVEWRRAELDGKQRTFGSQPVGMELYDYQEDPLETQNLATNPAYAEALRQHQAVMDSLLPYLPRRVGQ